MIDTNMDRIPVWPEQAFYELQELDEPEWNEAIAEFMRKVFAHRDMLIKKRQEAAKGEYKEAEAIARRRDELLKITFG